MSKKNGKVLTLSIEDFFKILGSIICVGIIVAFVVFIIVQESNALKSSKVDIVNIGDSREQVKEILGEPYNENDGLFYEYYSSNYIKLMKEIEKKFGNSFDMNNEYSSVKDSIDKELEDAFDDLENEFKEMEKYAKKLKELKYDCAVITFDSEGKVQKIILEKNKRFEVESSAKQILNQELVTKEVKQNTPTDLVYKIEYGDGSLYKFIVKYGYINSQIDEKGNCKVQIDFSDAWGNKISEIQEIKVTK